MLRGSSSSRRCRRRVFSLDMLVLFAPRPTSFLPLPPSSSYLLTSPTSSRPLLSVLVSPAALLCARLDWSVTHA